MEMEAWVPVWCVALWVLHTAASAGGATFLLAVALSWGGLLALFKLPSAVPPFTPTTARLILYAPISLWGVGGSTSLESATFVLQLGAATYTLLSCLDPQTPATSSASKALHHFLTLYLLGCTLGAPATRVVGATILWAYSVSSWFLALHQSSKLLEPIACKTWTRFTAGMVLLSWGVVRLPVTLAASMDLAFPGSHHHHHYQPATYSQLAALVILNSMNLYWFGKILYHAANELV